MFVTSPKQNGKTVVRIVHSFRDRKGKPTNRVVHVIGRTEDSEAIEHYKSIARDLIEQHKRGVINLHTSLKTLRINLFHLSGKDRYNRGMEDIFGESFKLLGFSKLLTSGRKNIALNEVLKFIVLSRIYCPSSKLKSCRLLETNFNKKISHKQTLTMMDHVSKNEETIRKEVFERLLDSRECLDVLLFDVTTLYFESVEADDLRKFGEVQVVLSVLSDQHGLPLAYEIFEGDTAETETFSQVLRKFSQNHNIKKFRVIADRAMFSKDNFAFLEGLPAELEIEGEYTVGSPLRKFSKNTQEDIFSFKRKVKRRKKKENANLSVYEFTHNGRRIIVSYSEKSAKRDEKKRDKIVNKLTNMASDKGNILTKDLIKNSGVKRYLKTPQKTESKIDKAKILNDKKWDGLFGVCTNRTDNAKDILSSYRNLWRIEELFRINKHTLSMRPIYHRLSTRIRAHILICFLAYSTLKRTEIQLQEAGIQISLERLIELLSSVEYFVLNDRSKNDDICYCIPKELSDEAQSIYSAFDVIYPTMPYVTKELGKKAS